MSQGANSSAELVLVCSGLDAGGVVRVVSTLARLGAELDDWRLAVLGNGELEEDLRSRAASLGIKERVTEYDLPRSLATWSVVGLTC